ncbi:MAG: asparagine synthetase B family protein [Candidatus Binataceae bacterium]
MSGLIGIWNFEGEPVESEALSAMAKTIAHRGGDGLEFSLRGPVGFGCHLRRVTPESRSERQPLIDSDGNVLLFDGRIDNRAELLAALDLPSNAPQVSDCEVVSMAFRMWDRKCLERLLGDFALAIFVPREHRLILARDPVGCRPLYYWSDGQRFIFASEIKAILAHPAVRVAPNLDLVADSLLLNQLPYEDEGETFFAGVYRVLPGYRLKVTPAKTTSKCFWNFNPAGQIRYQAYSDYSTHLRNLLVQAVRRRMRSSYPVAVAISGGLDSSIVLGIADQINRQAPNAGLLPISYAPTSDRASEENEFIRLMETRCELEIHRVDMGSAGDPRHLAETAWHSESPFFDDSWCAETPMLAYAHDQRARVLLTGLWSDQYMFATGYLVDLWKKLAWRRVRRHLAEYSKWFVDCDPGYFRARFYREMMLNLTPTVMRSMVRPFYSETAAFHSNRSWISRELIARARRRRPRLKHPRYASVHGRNIYQTVHAKSHRLQIDADEKMAARFGLERSSPFLDRDVIAFLMAVPGEIQTMGGVPRALLRDAARGFVPRAIRLRRWRDEGTVSTQIEHDRFAVYRDAKLGGFACEALGFTPGERLSDTQYLEAMGLEFWVRAFLLKHSGDANSDVAGLKEAI